MNDGASETEFEDEVSMAASHLLTIPAGYATPHSEVSQRPISPPCLKRKHERGSVDSDQASRKLVKSVNVPSPIHLTRIKKSPDEYNVDCITLHDLIGDPDIVECWQFNFLFDVDFLMYAPANRSNLK